MQTLRQMNKVIIEGYHHNTTIDENDVDETNTCIVKIFLKP